MLGKPIEYLSCRYGSLQDPPDVRTIVFYNLGIESESYLPLTALVKDLLLTGLHLPVPSLRPAARRLSGVPSVAGNQGRALARRLSL